MTKSQTSQKPYVSQTGSKYHVLNSRGKVAATFTSISLSA